jgi:hypothetical protein
VIFALTSLYFLVRKFALSGEKVFFFFRHVAQWESAILTRWMSRVQIPACLPLLKLICLLDEGRWQGCTGSVMGGRVGEGIIA